MIAPLKISGTTRADNALSFNKAFTGIDLRDTHKAAWSMGRR